MPSSKTTAAKVKRNNALGKSVQPDAALSAVVGSAPLPRTELTKKIWEYHCCPVMRSSMMDYALEE